MSKAEKNLKIYNISRSLKENKKSGGYTISLLEKSNNTRKH
jgi:hypothetical protein